MICACVNSNSSENVLRCVDSVILNRLDISFLLDLLVSPQTTQRKRKSKRKRKGTKIQVVEVQKGTMDATTTIKKLKKILQDPRGSGRVQGRVA